MLQVKHIYICIYSCLKMSNFAKINQRRFKRQAKRFLEECSQEEGKNVALDDKLQYTGPQCSTFTTGTKKKTSMPDETKVCEKQDSNSEQTANSMDVQNSSDHISNIETIINSLHDNGQEDYATDEEAASCDAECVRDSMANWATRYQISLVALSALLVILQNLKLDVPKDARTLLKTSVNELGQKKAGALFYCRGIKSAILCHITDVILLLRKSLMFSLFKLMWMESLCLKVQILSYGLSWV